ncbi:MAG: 7-cyano-7-deazaguanine synthase QueC [Hyphomicrobiales bacterium]|nr:7-cyano-7-deazaguanine synthase QueC [Hyphomicrobiales bacterium]
MTGSQRNAIVLFSGGQDSTTCLAWALNRFENVETIAFDYGQRHAVELSCQHVVLNELRARFPQWEARLGPHHEIDLHTLKNISDTALTHDAEIVIGDKGLPNTFVPGRNILFLTMAAAIAYRRDIRHIVGGMCETDYSGYPDCRDDTIKAVQLALNLGMEARLVIDTPLMWLTKAATWQLADDLGGRQLVDLIIHHTHTCYLGDRVNRHPWGYGCGRCPACRLRAHGYEQFLNGS